MPLEYWSSAPRRAGASATRVPLFQIDLNDINVLQDLARLVLEYEEEIKRRHRPARVGGEEDIEDSLTSRYYAFNVLTWPEPAAQALKRFLKAGYLEMLGLMPLVRRERTYIQCWANTVRRGENIRIHNHGDRASYFSGNLSVQVEDPERSFTHFTMEREAEAACERYSVPNLPGRLTIFPSWVYHYTDPWPHDAVRISIAFDIVNQEIFERQARYRVARKYIPFDDPAGG